MTTVRPESRAFRLGPAGERATTSAGGGGRRPSVRGTLRRSSGRGVFRTLLKWAFVLAIWGGIGSGVVLAWFAAGIPDIDKALSPTRKPTMTILAANGVEIATLGEVFGRPLTVAEMPPPLPRAVLAIEDKRFYRHFGLDPIRLVGALVANVRAGTVVQGGSTITQQLAKNLFLTSDRTMRRKIQEAMLALWIEQRFTKDQILALYLNRAYFGAGAYGVDAAAEKYFDRPATRLTIYQSAMLAGMLKAPSRFNPLVNPDLAEDRARVVLNEMAKDGFITEGQMSQAWRDRGRAVAQRRASPGARYFADWIAAQAPALVTDRNRDLVVLTTLDTRLQAAAERRLEEALGAPAARTANVGQAALVAMSDDGAVRALVGGREYADSPFNRATQAYRQPGSAFKPIVFAAGLESGLTPDTRMIDGPIRIGGWSPKNLSERYQGEVTLREALAQSINTVAAQVGQHAGVRHVVDVARRLGITADLDANATLSLGSSDVSLVELTAAYAAFANGGQGVWAYGVQEIQDASGQVLYSRSGSGPGRAVSPEVARDVTAMMVAVIDWGTGKAARLGRPAAGKTGTSQDYRDAWFVGFTSDLVCGVWMGNDDDRGMNKVTGGTLPAKLWRSFMADSEVARPARPLPSLTTESPPPIASRDEAPASPIEAPNFFERLLEAFGG